MHDSTSCVLFDRETATRRIRTTGSCGPHFHIDYVSARCSFNTFVINNPPYGFVR